MQCNGEIHTRQRMRPWLEARINSGEIAGLEWVDYETKTFKVPWKHVGNREWKEHDSQIFKEWAVHTGRYREGVDDPDYPTWKTRFRCALTKLPDIKELKNRSHLDGQNSEPYRVYQFINRQDARVAASNNHVTLPQQPVYQETVSTAIIKEDLAGGRNGMDFVDGFDFVDGVVPHTHNTLPVSQAGVSGIPRTVQSVFTGACSDPQLDSDLNEIRSDDLVKCTKEEFMDMEYTETHSPNSDVEVCPEAANKAIKSCPGEESVSLTSQFLQNVQQLSDDETDHQLHVTVRYREKCVIESLFSEPAGVRLYHGPPGTDMTNGLNPAFNEEMFGPYQASQVPFPQCTTNNQAQDKLTGTLLRAMDRGTLLRMENGNIIATRKCRCTVFISSPSLNEGQTTKLVRERPTVVYDYQSYFKPALEKYMHGTGPKPSTMVVLGFGQKFNMNQEPVTNLLISATIHHAAATCLITRISCSSPMSPPIEISKSDDYDKYLDQLKTVTELRRT